MATAIGELGLGWLTGNTTRDGQLAVAATAAAEVTIESLVLAYSALLYRVAFSILRHPAEAEDVVQETFVRVLEQRTRLDSLREPRQWLVRIAWNLSLDRKRRVAPQQLDDLVAVTLRATGRGADDALAEARRLRDVLAIMDGLPRRERDVLLLAAVEELPAREIAAVLELSESGVRSLLFRARAHVEERLANRNRTVSPKGEKR